MTQTTKSPAHTPDCRKVLDPSNCTCHVTAYLDQHPHACTNHTLAWHWKHAASCEEFDASLDDAVGFQQLTEDDAAAESRRFKIGRDAKVVAESVRARGAERKANMWQKIATIQTGLYTASLVIFAGQSIGWW